MGPRPRAGGAASRVLVAALATVGLALLVGAAVGAPPRSAATRARPGRVGAITEMAAGPSTDVYLFGLASGPDGAIWFPNSGCMARGRCAVVRLTPAGGATSYRRGLNPGSVPLAIATGSGGDLWFTDQGRRPAIGRVTPRGRITEFTRGLAGGEPFEITSGPGGDMWFTQQGAHPAIGRITPQGRITLLRRGLSPQSIPFGIAAGPGPGAGAVWFTDRGCSAQGECAVGRVGSDGRITEFSAGLRAGAQPLGIAAGPADSEWFADSAGAIGEVSAAGQIRERSRGLARGSSPVAIAAGPDGDMWFTDEGSTPAVGRITPRGAVREYTAGLISGSQPGYIAAASDGRMWFSDEGGTAALGAVSTGVPPALRVDPGVVGAAQPGAPLTCAPGRWATWAGRRPSLRLFAFDGYRWVRDGSLLPDRPSRLHILTAAEAGARFACRETVTYPPPLSVTASADSAAVRAPLASRPHAIGRGRAWTVAPPATDRLWSGEKSVAPPARRVQ